MLHVRVPSDSPGHHHICISKGLVFYLKEEKGSIRKIFLDNWGRGKSQLLNMIICILCWTASMVEISGKVSVLDGAALQTT